MKIHAAKLLFDTRSVLSEGPIWDWRRECLFWVDIEGKRLHQFDLASEKNTTWDFDFMVGSVVVTESGKLILAMEPGLYEFNVDTENLKPLNVLKNRDVKMRYNDGKVSPKGDLWIGSMHKEFMANVANLYCVDQKMNAQVKIPATTISNGMAWSSDSKTFYFIDSPTFAVTAYDFDTKSGSISNKRSIIKIPEDYGAPDGMCIDAEGMLWIAHWGGSCIRCWDPNSGKVISTVEVDAPHVTSCCFGGKDLDTLYITTARSGLSKTQLQEFPSSGGLFVCYTGKKGTAITYFKDT